MGKWLHKNRFFLAIFLMVLIFVILHFTGTVEMGWVWILSPIWLPCIEALVACFVEWIAKD